MSGRLAEMKGTACRGDEPALVDQIFGVLEAKRKGDWDHSALLTLVERGSGVRAT